MITVPTEKTCFICFNSAKLQDIHTTIMTDDNVCNKLSQDLSHFSLDRRDEGLGKDSLEEERIILQPNTALERHLVSTLISQVLLYNGELQPWSELLGQRGNKSLKMTYFPLPSPPDAMLMSGIQVIFGRLNIAWGKGGQNKWFTKIANLFFRGGFRVYLTKFIFSLNFHNCPMMF